MKRVIAILILVLSAGVATAGPLKVYIMAGQSNMQGHSKITTLGHMKLDPVSVPILEKILDEKGEPRIFDDIYISTMGCARNGEKHGKLSVGYGADRSGPQIGPELTFGIYMQEFVKEPILIIKTAWGGKSLCVDFRPPSAGKYRVVEGGSGSEEEVKNKQDASGHYYRLMMEHVKHVLSDIKRVYPDYDEKEGYKVEGFVWFQGCNDFGEKGTYPNPGKPGGFDEYTRLLACLIRDVRKEVDAPDMKAVIGVIGINGELETERFRQIEPEHVAWLRVFRKAMAAPAEMPEFKGKVAAVHTAEFWEPQLEELQGRWKHIKAGNNELKKRKLPRDEYEKEFLKLRKSIYNDAEWKAMEGVSNAAYHYMGSAKIMARIGKAFAEAMAGMTGREQADTPGYPGTKSVYAGKFDMYRDDGNIVVVPNTIADGKPWVWRARFFNAFPAFDIAMLERGYHVVYCNVGGLFGNDEAVTRWDNYYKWLTEEHGFSKKPILEGMSRGGLIVYNWAIANPEKVGVIYGDAAVMDLRSWPGFESRGMHRAYKFESEEAFNSYKGNPVDNLAPLAKAGIPIIHVVGDKDDCVPVAENTAVAEKGYKEMGGLFEVIHKEDCGHHPHSLEDPSAIIAFVEKHALR